MRSGTSSASTIPGTRVVSTGKAGSTPRARISRRNVGEIRGQWSEPRCVHHDDLQRRLERTAVQEHRLGLPGAGARSTSRPCRSSTASTRPITRTVTPTHSLGRMCLGQAGSLSGMLTATTQSRSRQVLALNVIHLRAATLAEGDPGAGGYVSWVSGFSGGFTIANGVVIENAVGAEATTSSSGTRRPTS